MANVTLRREGRTGETRGRGKKRAVDFRFSRLARLAINTYSSSKASSISRSRSWEKLIPAAAAA